MRFSSAGNLLPLAAVFLSSVTNIMAAAAALPSSLFESGDSNSCTVYLVPEYPETMTGVPIMPVIIELDEDRIGSKVWQRERTIVSALAPNCPLDISCVLHYTNGASGSQGRSAAFGKGRGLVETVEGVTGVECGPATRFNKDTNSIERFNSRSSRTTVDNNIGFSDMSGDDNDELNFGNNNDNSFNTNDGDNINNRGPGNRGIRLGGGSISLLPRPRENNARVVRVLINRGTDSEDTLLVPLVGSKGEGERKFDYRLPVRTAEIVDEGLSTVNVACWFRYWQSTRKTQVFTREFRFMQADADGYEALICVERQH